MGKFFMLMVCTYAINMVHAQNILNGTVLNAKTNIPVEGAIISCGSHKTVTNATGSFGVKLPTTFADTVYVYCIGFAKQSVTTKNLEENSTILLWPTQVLLADVVVTANTGNQFKTITEADIAMRGINNSQEILRIIPGLFIGQHQGGGKAEQIFLRGFDADHGTDVRLEVDGMPVNMVNHAHGQGYADSHFLIPETVEGVDFKKGPYTAAKGDFASAGHVDFRTRDFLTNNEVRVEGGMFNTWRALAMVNLLPPQNVGRQQSWYAAAEYAYTDSYFDNSQKFNRVNVFSKYTGRVGSKSTLSLSASTFYSRWNASGQIPIRAVEQKIIGFYGAVDPNEGGTTSRTNVNAQLVTNLQNGAVIKNQLFYSRLNFNLYSNFTFFLEDPINGDQIRQREKRDLAGYNGSYTKTIYAGNIKVATEIGANVRADVVTDGELSYTLNRTTVLNPLKFGNIGQLNWAPYISQNYTLSNRLTVMAGLRYDQFYFRYNNKLAEDTTLPGNGLYTTKAGTISPKLNIYYNASSKAQLYFSAGRGFHSNDARAAVVQNGDRVLPASLGFDVGTVIKPIKNMVVNVAAWYNMLQQEFVYSGDGGFIEFSGKTRRIGLDFSGRYQPVKNIYIDADVNYARARAIESEKGEDFVPLAPVWTSSGGVTYIRQNGLNAGIRYRYLANRPGNESNTITAEGYCIADVTIGMVKPQYEIMLFVNNVLNTQWKETQFTTLTQLKNEAQPVEEICFTPGTPFSARIAVSYFFGRR